MELRDFAEFLDDYLRIDEYQDSSVNGLQVEGIGNVERAAFSVDASMEAFRKAVEIDADILIVHHGIIWNCIERVSGIIRERLKFLLENELSLYAAHIPLDAHPEIGNNAMILRMVGVEPEEPFGEYKGRKIGFSGYTDLEFEEVLERLEDRFGEVGYMKFGRDEIGKVAAVSGRGASYVEEAVNEGIDLLITGEMEHSAYHPAKEIEMNIIYLGHYSSETVGLKALMNVVADIGIDVEFIDIPTDL